MTLKAVVLLGPTAVGKTALSLRLAQYFGGTVISGDSMQIYRHLNIGTAKILPQQQQGIPHRLIDICDVDQPYTVRDFQIAAQQLIEQLNARQQLPLIVGGTGFYLKSLIDNLPLGDDPQQKNAGSLRTQLRKQYQQPQGPQRLWQQLAQLDAVAAAKIPPTNQRRLLRALEVILSSGHKFSEQPQTPSSTRFLVLGLTTSRSLLYQRINQRVDQMVQAGLLQEAQWLYERRAQAPQACQAIGYKEWFPYFEHQSSQAQAVALIKRNSRRFAKRQLTYFRHQLTVHWYDLLTQPQQEQRLWAVVEKFWRH